MIRKTDVLCDMGTIKIFNGGLSCFFYNDLGDFPNTVDIYEKYSYKEWSKKTVGMKFLGHFTVKNKAYLSAYDCANAPCYTFDRGRWFVYLKEARHFLIVKVDKELHG